MFYSKLYVLYGFKHILRVRRRLLPHTSSKPFQNTHTQSHLNAPCITCKIEWHEHTGAWQRSIEEVGTEYASTVSIYRFTLHCCYAKNKIKSQRAVWHENAQRDTCCLSRLHSTNIRDTVSLSTSLLFACNLIPFRWLFEIFAIRFYPWNCSRVDRLIPNPWVHIDDEVCVIFETWRYGWAMRPFGLWAVTVWKKRRRKKKHQLRECVECDVSN